MSFNRSSYDKCAYSLQLSRSVGPGDYNLYAGYGESCSECNPLYGPINNKNAASSKKVGELGFGSLVDVESNLLNRVTPLNNCNQNLNKNICAETKVYNKPTCNRKIEALDTRFSHPLDNYRGMTTINYQFAPYLHVNPQSNIQCDDARHGESTRINIKENYTAPKQVKWDSGDSLPKPKNKDCLNNSC